MYRINSKSYITSDEWLQILNSLHLLDKLCFAKNIVIKPNLAAGSKADPDRHICTDMKLLSRVVELCHEINKSATIFIAESDSTGHGFAYLKFEHFNLPDGLQLVEEAKNVIRMLDLSRDRLTHIKNDRFMYFRGNHELWLSEQLSNSDFTISLANLKTHSVTLYTGACKNLFGCLPDFEKSGYHPFIHEVVHDLTLAIHPDLSILDAFYAMEKNGPVAGNDINGHFRIFSNNATEVDVLGAATIGINYGKVKYLKYLMKEATENILISEEIRNLKFMALPPDRILRINNFLGLALQKYGQNVANIGDILHVARTPARALIALFRPMLIKIFGLEKLKAIKKQIEGKNRYE